MGTAEHTRVIQAPSYFRPGTNLSGSNIAAGLILKAGATSGEVALATSPADSLVGVSVESVWPTNCTRDVQVDGKAKVLSGDVIAIGQLLTVDATSRAVPATLTAGTQTTVFARAVTDATGAGQWVEVELLKTIPSFVGSSTVADRAALKAIAAGNRFDGMTCLVKSDNSSWRFDANSSAIDVVELLVCTPASGTGRWVRVDSLVDLKLAVSKDTADAAVLFTVPAGMRCLIAASPRWEVTADFTGGSSSAIGLSSSNTAYNTKGDVLGGASGDVAASLTAAKGFAGTAGAKSAIVLVAGDTIRFDRVTSAFTAGTGFAHVPVMLLP